MVRGITILISAIAAAQAASLPKGKKLGNAECSFCPDGYDSYMDVLGHGLAEYANCGAPDYSGNNAYDYGECAGGLMCEGDPSWMQCAVNPDAPTCAPVSPPVMDGAAVAPKGYCTYSQIGAAVQQWQDCGHQDYNLATHWEWQSCDGGSSCQAPTDGTEHWACTALNTTTTPHPIPQCDVVPAPKAGPIPLAPEGYCSYTQEGTAFEEAQYCGHSDYANPTEWMWSTCANSRCQPDTNSNKWICWVDTTTTTPHTTTTMCSGVPVPTSSDGVALAPAGWCLYVEESESVASNQVCGHLDYTGAYGAGAWFYGLCMQGFNCQASTIIADQWECFQAPPTPCTPVSPPTVKGVVAAPAGYCTYIKNLGKVADNQMCGHPDWNTNTTWDYGTCSVSTSVCQVAPADPTQWDCIPPVAVAAKPSHHVQRPTVPLHQVQQQQQAAHNAHVRRPVARPIPAAYHRQPVKH